MRSHTDLRFWYFWNIVRHFAGNSGIGLMVRPWPRGRSRAMMTAVAAVFLASCALCDLTTKKVPNRLLLGWLFVWIAVVIPLSGRPLSEEARFLARMAGTVLVLFPVFRFRMAGAGDVKTAAILAGMVGAEAAGRALFSGLLAAAAWSACRLVRKKMVAARLRRLAEFLGEMRAYAGEGKLCGQKTVPAYRREEDRDAEFCLIPFFFLGFLLTEWIGWRG